jgi:hypothetical protein
VLRSNLRARAPGLYARALRAGLALDRLVAIGATAHLVIRQARHA